MQSMRVRPDRQYLACWSRSWRGAGLKRAPVGACGWARSLDGHGAGLHQGTQLDAPGPGPGCSQASGRWHPRGSRARAAGVPRRPLLCHQPHRPPAGGLLSAAGRVGCGRQRLSGGGWPLPAPGLLGRDVHPGALQQQWRPPPGVVVGVAAAVAVLRCAPAVLCCLIPSPTPPFPPTHYCRTARRCWTGAWASASRPAASPGTPPLPASLGCLPRCGPPLAPSGPPPSAPSPTFFLGNSTSLPPKWSRRCVTLGVSQCMHVLKGA